MQGGVQRVSARVPEAAKDILWWEDTLWRQARGHKHLHHARKWATKATKALWAGGRREEAIRFAWARERARIGIAIHPPAARMDREEKEALGKAVAFYSDCALGEFERLMVHYMGRGMPPRAWMFADREAR